MPTRILVVEDSPTQAEALRLLLEEHGYTVTVAPDGEQALALVANSKVDLVLSDITMPGISGYDVCRRVKAELKRRDLPVILLSSLTDPMDIVHGLEAGADNYVTKPYEPEHLVARVRHVLENRDLRRGVKSRVGVNVTFLGSTFTITSEKEQILDLLISTFEDAVQQNKQLRRREEELEAARAELARYAGTLEQRLQSVLESVPDVVFSVNAALTELYYISPACKRVLGFTPEQFAADMSRWRAAIHPKDRLRVIAAYEGAAKAARQATAEYRVQDPDGSVRWIQETIIPIADERGVVARLDGVARDITEQRRLEEQLRQSQKMEAIGQLAGGVAHDFNNILTAIMGYGELLLEDLGPDDRRRGDVLEIRKAAERAAALTRQLLAFSRKQVLEPRVLDLNEVVTNLDKMLRRLIGEDVELRTVLGSDLGAVRADAGQLEQVIVNLAVNARDAMPRGGKLTIETADVELDGEYAARHVGVTPGRYVMIAVSDTGIGMDEGTKARIFEPFFSTKGPVKGTGLGLSTVYGIVKQSGGNIWVYSELGRGTTFKIYLPRVDEPAEALRPSAEPAAGLRGSETILLVEDDEPLRVLARRTLTSRGYTVLEADRGATALRVAREHREPIHLMLTDVVMPEMAGHEVARQLRNSHPETLVLYMSGYTDETIVHHGVLEPGIAYLQKPFTPEALARKVREMLDAK